ncbi:hypothetical protein KAFR_0B01770 [Kazachstania africana CBS 2517]|uniref:Bromodomain associated domain-containing protein n=1 Tax=Kazachstania africana (strain ATCC 22294 / BCRC 22015 / CBS 2517 / CECT 1963 / NBRC 1671 / NRRL Y-8276) TaxID=1071382 RepID=H2AQ26_KAZAF|nr:hypothetical protein KAFR_0B01770 [Kazachstania africana CBS 2517]CCF56476.1 hypothetical protein KAFR_0B01770 [Kazachstania africana CBS 2517]
MATSNNDFYFGLLRISMLQLLKSQGFDKSKPTTVDTVTDLYIKFLNLLISEIQKLARARCDLDDSIIAIQDISQSFVNLGLIRPIDLLDVYDENPGLSAHDKAFTKLREWILDSIQFQNSIKVAFPNIEPLKISSSEIQNQSINDTDNSNNKQLTNKLDYITQLQGTNGNAPRKEEENKEENDLIEDLINNGETDDWIRFLITKQRLDLIRRRLQKSNNKENKVPDMNNLPNIAGLKHSILSRSLHLHVPNSHDNAHKSPNEMLPSQLSSSNKAYHNDITTDDANIGSNQLFEIGSNLEKILPAMTMGNRIENIGLSYDNYVSEDENAEEEDEKEEQEEGLHSQKKDYVEEEQNEPFNTNTTGNNLQFSEMEDMDNTFQRRDSLDYDNQSIF